MPFDFDAQVSAPFRMQPGLRRLAPGAAQLTPQRPGSRHQREKLAVLSAYADQALLACDDFDATPALAALCAHAAAEQPDAFAWDGQRAHARWLGTAVEGGVVTQLGASSFGLGDEVARCLHTLPARWRLAGLLSLAFAEDFAVINGTDTRIVWLAVALPSNWAPEAKIGRGFAEVHAPVPDNSLLVGASAALARLVTQAERWERCVWTVSAHPWLHAHPARCDAARWASTRVHEAWWRTEHQSFIPVPGHTQAVFTIHVQLQALADVLHSRERALRLHDAIASMSPAVLEYRGLAGVRGELLQWLMQRASGLPA